MLLIGNSIPCTIFVDATKAMQTNDVASLHAPCTVEMVSGLCPSVQVVRVHFEDQVDASAAVFRWTTVEDSCIVVVAMMVMQSCPPPFPRTTRDSDVFPVYDELHRSLVLLAILELCRCINDADGKYRRLISEEP